MDEDFVKIDVSNRVVRSSYFNEHQIKYFKNQNYIQLKNECLRANKLFVDPSFPPSNQSIFYSKPVPQGIRWLRPSQITIEPKFIENTANANDLDQGLLGNCWFVAGCAAITFMPELFSKVLPSNQEFDDTRNYAGIYHFRFWVYGFWYDVVVDDYLPVWEADKSLVFCSNREEPNEFWAALLEKAYAKVCGSYENLEGGHTTDALIDLSGGIEESFTMGNSRQDISQEELWKILVKSRQLKSMNAAYIEPDMYTRDCKLANGLVKGHAYTVTKVAAVEGVRWKNEWRLIRVRNPWGRIEWKGAWSDHSAEWSLVSEQTRCALEFKKENEGEFWMSFDDFYRHFDSIQFCHITPEAFSDELLKMPRSSNSTLGWNMIAYHGEWARNVSAGGSGNGNDPRYWQNPQFLVKLVDVDMYDNENMSTVIISLMQKYTREKRTARNGQSAEEFIQFRLYRVNERQVSGDACKFNEYQSGVERVGNSGNYVNKREITKRFRVTPGYYLIIPSLFDYNATGEFLLRVFTEKAIQDDSARVLERSSTSADHGTIRLTANPAINPGRNVPTQLPSSRFGSGDGIFSSIFPTYGQRLASYHTLFADPKAISDDTDEAAMRNQPKEEEKEKEKAETKKHVDVSAILIGSIGGFGSTRPPMSRQSAPPKSHPGLREAFGGGGEMSSPFFINQLSTGLLDIDDNIKKEPVNAKEKQQKCSIM